MRRMSWKYASGNVEIRDGLDICWWSFLQVALPGCPFLPLPNAGNQVMNILRQVDFSGFILTGGDDWGVFPQRDETETAIFEFSRERGLPILGVCRGAQVINRLMGGNLAPVSGHSGARHLVRDIRTGSREVNSWHNYAINSLGAGLVCNACDDSGHVEAFASANENIQGIMWHPEREQTPDSADIQLFARMFIRNK